MSMSESASQSTQKAMTCGTWCQMAWFSFVCSIRLILTLSTWELSTRARMESAISLKSVKTLTWVSLLQRVKSSWLVLTPRYSWRRNLTCCSVFAGRLQDLLPLTRLRSKTAPKFTVFWKMVRKLAISWSYQLKISLLDGSIITSARPVKNVK